MDNCFTCTYFKELKQGDLQDGDDYLCELHETTFTNDEEDRRDMELPCSSHIPNEVKQGFKVPKVETKFSQGLLCASAARDRTMEGTKRLLDDIAIKIKDACDKGFEAVDISLDNSLPTTHLQLIISALEDKGYSASASYTQPVYLECICIPEHTTLVVCWKEENKDE